MIERKRSSQRQAGQSIDPSWARRYAATGLLTSQQQADGSTALALTDAGQLLLPLAPKAAPNVPPQGQDNADDPSQPLPVRISRVRQDTLDQQQSILNEFPDVGQPGSAANQKFVRAFQATGSDPRKALQVARAVFGGG